MGFDLGWGRSFGRGMAAPPQYYCLENPTGQEEEQWSSDPQGCKKSRTASDLAHYYITKLSLFEEFENGGQKKNGYHKPTIIWCVAWKAARLTACLLLTQTTFVTSHRSTHISTFYHAPPNTLRMHITYVYFSHMHRKLKRLVKILIRMVSLRTSLVVPVD